MTPDTTTTTTGTPPTTWELARRLRLAAENLQSFLGEQLRRLEEVAQECERVLSSRHVLQQAYDELQRERRQWEQQREQKQQEIQEEQDRLIDAWKTLEEEQRKLLARDEGASRTPAPRTAWDSATSPPVAETPTPTSIDKSVFVEGTPTPVPASGVISREAALEQFERLKRDIRKHSQLTRQNSPRPYQQ